MAPPTVKKANSTTVKTKPADSTSKIPSTLIKDQISAKLDTNETSSQCHALIDDIRSLLAPNATSSKNTGSKDALILAVTKLRNLNRHSNFKNRISITKLADTKLKVEEQYLSLQNIVNEIAHLRKNIENCMDFSPSDADVELVDLEEFHKNASEDLSQLDLTKSDDQHQLHLARLNYELNERKSMLATLHELEGRKSALLSDIRGKEQRLCQIKPKISSIKRSMTPLLDFVGLKLRSKHFSKLRQAQGTSNNRQLQLRPIFVNEDICRELFGDKSIEIGSDAQIVIKETKMENEGNIDSEMPQENGTRNAPLPSNNLKTLIQAENDLAAEEDFALFHSKSLNIISTFRSMFSNASDLSGSAETEELLQQAIVLRQHNRLMQIINANKRSKMVEIRKATEMQTTKLQTIITKTAYLRNSIAKCLEYKSSNESDIEMIPIEQFYNEVPISISRREVTRNNPHLLHLARLKYELATRKSLCNQVQEIGNEIKNVLSAITATERILAKVDPRVENLKKTAKPLLDIVGLKSVTLSVHNKEIPFRPVPVNSEIFKEIFGEKSSAKTGQRANLDDAKNEELEDWERELAMDIGEDI